MNKNIKFEKGKYGIKATVISRWQESYLKLLLDNNISELELNLGKGWRGENIDFLYHFPHLKSFILIDMTIKNIEPVHHLTNLLRLQLDTYSRTPVNFLSFPRLRDCGFEWIKGSDSLFECSSLRSLFINNYKGKDSTVFSSLINLERLDISNAGMSNLNGLSRLNQLKSINLSNLRNIRSLQGIETMKQLETLEIYKCKNISTLSEIFQLSEITRLLIIDCGKINSLKGIERLTKLKEFLFYESTNIVDGDISPLFKLKELQNIAFQNRRHYTHKCEDFGEKYFNG